MEELKILLTPMGVRVCVLLLCGVARMKFEMWAFKIVLVVVLIIRSADQSEAPDLEDCDLGQILSRIEY